MRKTVLLLLLSCAFAGTGLAQVRRLTGRVIASEDGQGLPDASVIYKGSTTGANADADGKFALSVPGDGVLIVSFVGFASKEISIGNQTNFTVELIPDTRLLAEVVVTAFGIER